jgi:ribonuclease P protein component
MIPKTSRISREDFEKVMKKGGFLNSSFFTFRFLENPLKSTHFSVVVSKKIAKTAVSRNKIRRRVYSIIKKHTKELKKPYFITFFAKKGVETAKFNEVEQDILKILEKSKIL